MHHVQLCVKRGLLYYMGIMQILNIGMLDWRRIHRESILGVQTATLRGVGLV